MSLDSAFYSSLSGLTSNANALGVIGNNLANLNTTGFKASTASFSDLYNTALTGTGTEGNGNPMQVGLGTTLASTSQDFSQGSPQATGTVTNMALQGNGFFVLKTAGGATVYSRAGDFSEDKTGYLVDPSGNSVMGWNAVNGVVNANGTPQPIYLNPGITNPPVATTQVSNTTNLDSSTAYNASNPTTFTAPIAVYDSQGGSHNLEVTYTQQPNAANGDEQWQMTVGTDDSTVTSVNITPSGSTTPGTSMMLEFNSSGTLVSPTGNPTLGPITWASGATNSSIAMNIWSSGSSPTSSLTSYSQASGTTATTQNGYAAGTVTGMTVDNTGTIIGTFTNGQTMPLGQVALATFSNPNGLSQAGGSTWSSTLASGTANVGTASSGGRGSVLGSNLESSNVDVATEFTKLIINQNGYEANSRVITTANTLLQTVISLIQA